MQLVQVLLRNQILVALHSLLPSFRVRFVFQSPPFIVSNLLSHLVDFSEAALDLLHVLVYPIQRTDSFLELFGFKIHLFWL